MTNTQSEDQDKQIQTQDTPVAQGAKDESIAPGAQPMEGTPVDRISDEADVEPATAESAQEGEAGEAESQRRRILIGSQRDPAAYRARRSRDWTPVVGPGAHGEEGQDKDRQRKQRRGRQDRRQPSAATPASPMQEPAVAAGANTEMGGGMPPATEGQESQKAVAIEQPGERPAAPVESPRPERPDREPRSRRDRPRATEGGAAAPVASRRFPAPSARDKLTPDMEAAYEQALGSVSLDVLMAGSVTVGAPAIEEGTQLPARVVAVARDEVFVELGTREQGTLPLKQFDAAPEVGATLEVVVQRLNPEDGLYELSLPNTAVDIGDWADIKEGMLVDVHVTGHNTGGLECEVNHLRGFIPISQIALYRVEDLVPYVDQRFTCLVTEANPQRRNLVLSRRAVLEREKEEARKQLFESLKPGQVHEGTVRKLMDFGAFVDLGGVDGLLHVSQLGWSRIRHPSEVLQEGQKIRVRIEKIDAQTGKLSLGYRDMFENPWEKAAQKYLPNSAVDGTVTKLMEFGAFVELEPGVEGLVHISELATKRVWRVSDVVKEGDKVQVMVLSVDQANQRISLSMRRLAEPEPVKKPDEAEPELPAAQAKKRKHPDRPLTGGLGKVSGGERFGLNW